MLTLSLAEMHDARGRNDDSRHYCVMEIATGIIIEEGQLLARAAWAFGPGPVVCGRGLTKVEARRRAEKARARCLKSSETGV